jgi:iron complex outermembrane receptor protein
VGSSSNYGIGRGSTEPSFNEDNRPYNNETKIGELRYASKSDSEIKWTFGLYYLRSTDPMDPVSRAARAAMGRGAADLYSDTDAAFGQVTIPFTDTLRAIAGARYSKDEKGYSNAVNFLYTAHSYAFNYFDYKIGIENDFAEDIMGYFTVASGHKPGGFDDQKATPFEMESNVSAELGIKSRLLDKRLQVNADVFYYKYKGYQVVDAFIERNPVTNLDEFKVRFFNAPAAQSQGAELETTALIGDATELNLALTYLKNEYSEDFFMHPVPTEEVNLKGFTMPHSPEFTVKGGIAHTFSFGDGSTLRPKLTYRWTDKQYLGYLIVPSNLGPAYAVLDFTMSYYSVKNWSLNFYANNGLNKHYYNGSVQQGPNTMVFPADPRTMGLTLNVKF